MTDSPSEALCELNATVYVRLCNTLNLRSRVVGAPALGVFGLEGGELGIERSDACDAALQAAPAGVEGLAQLLALEALHERAGFAQELQGAVYRGLCVCVGHGYSVEAASGVVGAPGRVL